MSSLLWNYIEESDVLNWFIFYDKSVLTDLLDRFHSSSLAFIIEDNSPMKAAIWRIWGGTHSEYLGEILRNLDIYTSHLVSGLSNRGAQTHPLAKDFAKQLRQKPANSLRKKIGELREPLEEFGITLEKRVSEALFQLEIQVAARGMQIAIILAIMSVILAVVSMAL